MSLIAVIAVSTIICACLFLLFSCLNMRKRTRSKKPRRKSNTDEENGNTVTDKPTGITTGVINVACEYTIYNISEDIYETCADNKIDIMYDYVTVAQGGNSLRDHDSKEFSPSADDSIYAILEAPSSEEAVRREEAVVTLGNSITSEEAVTLDPIYSTLENSSSELVTGPEVIYGDSNVNEGYIEDNEVPIENTTSKPVYFTLETSHGEPEYHTGYEDEEGTVEDTDVSGYTEVRHNGWSDVRNHIVRGDSKDIEGYMDDDEIYEDNYKECDVVDYVTIGSVIPLEKDERNPDGADDGIYEDWNDETVAGKLRVFNQYVKNRVKSLRV